MRVVLVDPSRTVLKYITRMLEARDHDVRPFVEGREALDYLRSDPEANALIASTELLSMSGVELCWDARLLASHGRPIYIVLMSSNKDRENLVRALDSGADDCIGRPPVPEELYARLRAAERLTSMQRELMRLATTDPLTGVSNRRAFFQAAEQIVARFGSDARLSAIMIDIDHFKQINDSYGHDIGDAALRRVARLAASESAVVGRLGGEEFAILLDGKGLTEAMELAERLRAKIASLNLKTVQGPITLTCSLGASEWRSDDTIDSLLRRADAALYAAKDTGRNRVVAETDLPEDFRIPGSVVRLGRTRNGGAPANQVAIAAAHT
jgi:two-component system, cell cycle response regulator